MADKTNIGWCDATWPVVAGCKEVSPGCAKCWAARQAATRLKHQPKYRGLAIIGANGHPHFTGEVRFWRKHLDWPLRWRKPRRIFPASSGDLFHEGVLDGQIMDVFRIVHACPQHTFQILTKRPERARDWFAKWGDWKGTNADELETKLARGPAETRAAHSAARARLFADMLEGWGKPPAGAAYPTYDWAAGPAYWPVVFPNVWLGVSVEDRQHGLPRIDVLREIPAAVRWLSVEPQLEDLGEIDLRGISWVVQGGESGPGSRPFQVSWAQSIRDQCAKAGVAYFFKQAGGAPMGWTCASGAACTHPDCGPQRMKLRDRKGTDLTEIPGGPWPRQFPGMRP